MTINCCRKSVVYTCDDGSLTTEKPICKHYQGPGGACDHRSGIGSICMCSEAIAELQEEERIRANENQRVKS